MNRGAKIGIVVGSALGGIAVTLIVFVFVAVATRPPIPGDALLLDEIAIVCDGLPNDVVVTIPVVPADDRGWVQSVETVGGVGEVTAFGAGTAVAPHELQGFALDEADVMQVRIGGTDRSKLTELLLIWSRGEPLMAQTFDVSGACA